MTLDTREICRYLSLGRREPDEALLARIEALRPEAMEAIRPRSVWTRFDDWAANHTLFAAGLRLAESKTLSLHLKDCHAVYLICGTLGPRFDALARRSAVSSSADALILQAIGAAGIEELMDGAGEAIRAELREGETLVPRYSPGFGDFPLAAQRPLLGLLDTPRAIGVSLTDSLLMVPSKSVSAVIGVKACF
jgi:hypothetical protein